MERSTLGSFLLARNLKRTNSGHLLPSFSSSSSFLYLLLLTNGPSTCHPVPILHFLFSQASEHHTTSYPILLDSIRYDTIRYEATIFSIGPK